jgi:hypothetical protein
MVTIAIDRLIYKITNKDFNILKLCMNNPLYDNQFDNKELNDQIDYITLKYTALDVVEEYLFTIK